MQTAKSIRFTAQPELCAQIDSYCKERGCSRNWFIEQAVSQYLLECMEDKEDYEIAAAALRKFESGDGKTYSSAELRKEFGLEG
ncbi:MAG: ribbon-helix-helix protein, CopG family [Treponema sp.]|nr:ribbon-helix-helix protein, CopG family [Treponema sp.]